MLGYTRQELLGRPINTIISSESQVERPLHMAELRAGKVVLSERPVQRADGSFITVEINAKGLPDGRLQGIVRDVSERKRQERALVLLSDVQRELVHLNKVGDVCRLVGAKVQELLGDSIVAVSIIDPEVRAMKPVGIYSPSGLYERLLAIAGKDPSEQVYPLDKMTAEEADLFRSGLLERFEGGLYRLLVGRFPKRICGLLERQLKLQGIYVLGLNWDAQSFGGLSILERGDLSPYRETIETIASQAAIAIRRILSEEALRQSEERYRLLFELSPDAIMVYQEGKVVFANGAAARLVGAGGPQELLGKEMLDFVHPDYHAMALERVRRMREQGNNLPVVEEGYLRLDGTPIDVDVTAAPFQYQGRPAFMAIIRDVTERKQAEELIQRQNRELTALNRTGQAFSRLMSAEEIGELLFANLGEVMDNHNVYVALYDEASQTLSFPIYTRDGRRLELYNRRFSNGLTEYVLRMRRPVLIAHDQAAFLEEHGIDQIGDPSCCYLAVPLQVGERLLGVLAIQDYEHTDIYDADDVELISTLGSQAAIALENARLYGAVQQELDERRRAEESLRASEARFATVFHSSPMSIALTRLSDDRMVDVNEAWEDLTGVSHEAAIGHQAADFNLWAEPAERRHLLERVRTSGRIEYAEMRLHNRFGEVRDLLMYAEAIELAGEACMLSMALDITDRKHAEEQEREAQRFAQATIDALSAHLCVLDKNGTILAVNQAWRDFGAQNPPSPAGDCIGANYLEVCDRAGGPDSDEAAPFAAGLRAVMRGEREQFVLAYPCNAPGGEKRWFNAKVTRFASQGPLRIVVSHENITERVRDEEQIKVLSKLPDESPNPILRVDAQGLLLYANKSSELIRQAWSIREGQVLPEPWRGLVEEVFRSAASREAEIQAGEQFFSFILAPIVSAGYVNLYGREVTQGKQAEEALRRSQAILAQAGQIAHLGAWEIELGNLEDLNANPLSWSDEVYRIFGYEPGQVASTNQLFFERVHPDDRARVAEAVAHALAERKPYQIEHRIQRPDGTERIVFEHALFVLNADGRPVRLLGAVQDITERKQAEETLRQRESQIGTIFEASQAGIILVDPQGIITLANRRMAEMFGCSLEQLTGSAYTDHIHPEQRTSGDDRMRALIAGQIESVALERRYLRQDGTDFWGFLSGRRLTDPSGQLISLVGIIADISESKQAEEVLASQSEELRQRNEELDRLYRASGSLLSSTPFDVPALARTIIDVVVQEFGQANCSVFLARRDTDELDRLAVAGPYADQVSRSVLTIDGAGIVPQSVRTGQVINTPDVRAVPSYVPSWSAARAELTIPLKIGSQIIGAIDVQSAQPSAFDADDERLMTIFAERAALVLEHARLFAQTETRLQNLTSLRTVDLAISSSFDLKITLGILLDQLVKQLNLHAADVLVFNPISQTFQYSAGQGFHTQALQYTNLRLGDGYAGRAARERHPIRIQNLDQNLMGLQSSAEFAREGFVSYLGIPLIAKGQIKGVLEIFQREQLNLDPEENTFLEMLSGQAAIAIDNTELFYNLQSSNTDLMLAYDSTLSGWASALELRDKETEGHTRRAADLTTRLARAVGIAEAELVHIHRGALLHDIGKMGIPDSIVLKPGPLTEDEWAVMRRHPQYAFEMLAPISYLQPAIDIPYCHHEHWDGSGYPRGLKGEQIPLAARVFSVIDVWDALTSDRPYRAAWSEEKTREYVRQQAGILFDPNVVDIFLGEVLNADRR